MSQMLRSRLRWLVLGVSLLGQAFGQGGATGAIDGTVQDAKFMQGSLAFARTAIDGVKQWKFKPYTVNGRAVSVQTQMTMTFKPGQQ